MKICIYGISHNNAEDVHEWMQEARHADAIIIGDLNSTDGTRTLLEQCGATVVNLNILPWRYDVARNALLSQVPPECGISMAIDLNQRLPVGWKDLLLRSWIPNTTKIRNPFCGPSNTFNIRIHSTTGYHWRRPVNEILSTDPNEQIVSVPELRITTIRDQQLGNFSKMLSTAIEESPTDGELLWMIGVHHSRNAEWDSAIDLHRRNINLGDSALFRSQSMIYLSGLIQTERLHWLTRAALETPWRKEPWFELADLYLASGDHQMALAHGLRASHLAGREREFLLDPKWMARLNDLIALSAYNVNQLDVSVHHAQLAVDYSPNDARLKNNLMLIRIKRGEA